MLLSLPLVCPSNGYGLHCQPLCHFTFATALITLPSANGVPRNSISVGPCYSSFCLPGISCCQSCSRLCSTCYFLSCFLFITGISVLLTFGVTMIGCSAFLSLLHFDFCLIVIFCHFIPYSANFLPVHQLSFRFICQCYHSCRIKFSPSSYFVFVGGVLFLPFAIFFFVKFFSLTVIGCSALLVFYLCIDFCLILHWIFCRYCYSI